MTKKIDKQKLILLVCEQLEKDLMALKAAALATYEAATNEESKPENEYDTRGLEASYLAGAQAKRVADIEELLYSYKDTKIKNFSASEPISSTALVEVNFNKKQMLIFIMAKGGGMTLSLEGIPVHIVTPTSPLGEALLGLKVGDTALVESGDKVREYEIISIQ